MSEKILSQQEIEALMSALSVEQESAAPESHDPALLNRTVKVYDFRRPDKFSKEHLRALRILHESFARSLGSALTSYLRTSLQLRLTMVEQVTYEEYIRSLPSPTVMYTVGLSPLPGQIVVELNLEVARVIMDRLLGGTGLQVARAREMTEIEMALLKTLSGFVVRSLGDTWSEVLPVEPVVQDPVLSPEFVQVTLAGETTAMLIFEVTLLKTTGTLSVCLPHPVLQSIMDKLTAQVWSAGAHGEVEDARLNTREPLNRVTLPVIVELGQADLTVSALLNLAEGSVIKLNTAADGSLPIRVGEHAKLAGRPGVVGRNVAVQITHVLA